MVGRPPDVRELLVGVGNKHTYMLELSQNQKHGAKIQTTIPGTRSSVWVLGTSAYSYPFVST